MEIDKLKTILQNLESAGVTEVQYLAVVTAYERAALWSSTDEDGTPFDDEKYEPYSWSEGAHDFNLESVAEFLTQNAEAVEQFRYFTGRNFGDVGHDLWLTRNGHGTGFWDRGFAGPAVEALTEAASAMGERYLYLSDDNEIEIS